jgi:O-antigen/teichoic acid export membrane protein
VSTLAGGHSLKKDTAFVYSAYLLRYLSLIILVPYYGRVLGPASYGKVLAAMSLMSIIWMIVGYGFVTTGIRDLAAATDMPVRSAIYSRHLLARLLLVPIAVVVGVAGTAWSPVLAADPVCGVIAILLGLVNGFNLGWFFQGLRNFRISMFIEALAYPINVVLILIFVRNQGDGVNALASLLASAIICTTLAYCFAAKRIRLVRLSLRAAVNEIRGSTVFFIQSINTLLMTSGATYLLSLLSTPEQVGYFGAAERFVALGLSFLGPAGQLLMPTIAHLHTIDETKASRLARKAIGLETAYGVVVLLTGIFAAPLFFPLILGSTFDGGVFLLQILVCLFPFAGFSHALGLYVIIPFRKDIWLVISATVGNCVSLAVALAAVHIYGAAGMAAARVAGEIMIAIILAGASIRLGLAKSIPRGIGPTGKAAAISLSPDAASGRDR